MSPNTCHLCLRAVPFSPRNVGRVPRRYATSRDATRSPLRRGKVVGMRRSWIEDGVLTFPVGLIYAVVSVVAMYRVVLYADVLLNFYYVLMNAYGWYFWLYGDTARRSRDELLVTWVPRQTTGWVGITGSGMTADCTNCCEVAVHPVKSVTVTE